MLRHLTPTHRAGFLAPWRWALWGAALGLVLAVLVFAPASWLANGVTQATAGQLQLQDARGTVWSGSARLALTGGAGSRDSTFLPGRVQWQLRPGWLSINTHITADCCTTVPLQAHISQRWGVTRLTIEDGSSQWPAELLAGMGTPWNTIRAEGTLILATQGLTVEWLEGRRVLGGHADLTVRNLSSRMSTLKPMGSYRLSLNGGASATLDLSTLEGKLQLSGNGRWVGSRLRFEGVASADPEHVAALDNLLNIIGRRNGARSIITLG